MRHKKAAVCCLLILMAAALFADDWVLAAEAFSGDEAAGTLMPSLILDSIPVSLVRTVSEQEQVFRKLLLLEKDQKKYVSNLEKYTRDRDSVIFSTDGAAVQREKIADYDKKIADERTLLQENQELYEKLDALSHAETDDMAALSVDAFSFERLEEKVVLWKKSTETLYPHPDKSEPSDIQALITGSVQVRKGFLYVKAGLVIYPGTIVCNEVVAAGKLSDAAVIAQELASAFVDVIVNATPVSLAFSIQPAAAVKAAEVTVDGMTVQNPETFHTFQSGIHTVTIASPGYGKQTFTRDFSEATRYQIDVTLPELHPGNLSLSAVTADGTPAESAQVWIAGRNAGNAPVDVTVNGKQVLGVIQENGGEPTFFALDTSTGDTDATIVLRNESNQSRIEKSRKSLYTAYGLLLLSLPFTFYCNGRMSDAANAYNSGIQTTLAESEFRKWQILGNISMCVSIGCGANMVYRLVRYMLDANSVLPEKDSQLDTDKEER